MDIIIKVKRFVIQVSFILLFLWSPYVSAQITLLEQPPFHSGEIIKYAAFYQWGLIEINAGDVQFLVDSISKDGLPTYHFTGIGISKSKYDWIYQVRDTFQSIVNANTFQPIFYERHTSEGNYTVHNRSLFQKESGKIVLYLENSEEGFSMKHLDWQDHLLDLQTAVYYARMLDPTNAHIDEEYTFHIIIDGEPFDITITYEGKENIKLSKGRNYSCHRISTEVIEGTIFSSHQRITIWVSDDGRQLPIKVEAPIIVGKIKAELIE